MSINKFEKDGKVAVLYSPGYGAGWSTWNSSHREFLCMDSELVKAVLSGNIEKAVNIASRYNSNIYCGGAEDLKVGWVPKGRAFEIQEYDGNESLIIIGEQDYMVA